MQVPTTIVTGFIGSGKTTLIGHLIDDLIAQRQKVAFIKNEVGDADVDAAILKGKNIQTQELLNGCICCTLVGPFITAINELITQVHPDRIIIEASGAADTPSLALMVSGHPQLKRDGVITVIDVVNFEGYEDLSITTKEQATFTDLIVFNKVELVDLEQKKRVVGYVRELNEFAPIIEAPQGHLNPELAFGLDSTELDQLLSAQPENPATHDHLHQDQITGFHLEIHTPISREKFLAWLPQVPKSIFRIKGILTLQDSAGQAEWYLFNQVGQRSTLEPITLTKSSPFQGKLIFIGFQADLQTIQIRKQFTEAFE
jgi:G3E family GTPase